MGTWGKRILLPTIVLLPIFLFHPDRRTSHNSLNVNYAIEHSHSWEHSQIWMSKGPWNLNDFVYVLLKNIIFLRMLFSITWHCCTSRMFTISKNYWNYVSVQILYKFFAKILCWIDSHHRTSSQKWIVHKTFTFMRTLSSMIEKVIIILHHREPGTISLLSVVWTSSEDQVLCILTEEKKNMFLVYLPLVKCYCTWSIDPHCRSK